MDDPSCSSSSLSSTTTPPRHLISAISRMAIAHQGKMIPLRKQDIALELKETKYKYKDVIAAVNKELSSSFGFELVQCPAVRKKSNIQTVAGREATCKEDSGSLFSDKMIIRTVGEERQRKIVAGIGPSVHNCPSELALLYLSLGAIHLSDGAMKFEDLKTLLEAFVVNGAKLDLFFKTKLKEAYFFKETLADEEKTELWSFGYRALVELPPKQIGLMFEDLLRTVDPEAPNHFSTYFS